MEMFNKYFDYKDREVLALEHIATHLGEICSDFKSSLDELEIVMDARDAEREKLI